MSANKRRNLFLSFLVACTLVVFIFLFVPSHTQTNIPVTPTSARAIESLAKQRTGHSIKVVSYFKTEEGHALPRTITIKFSNGPVEQSFDTLHVEYDMLPIVDSLLEFRPTLYDFEYTTTKDYGIYESSTILHRTYSPAQVAGILSGK